MSELNVMSKNSQKNGKTGEKEFADNPALKISREKRCGMKILIVVPKYEPGIEKRKSYYFLPLGLMYVSSYLKKEGFDVEPLNLNHYDDNKLESVLQQTTYDVICTGGLFTEIVQITKVIDTAKRIQPQAKTVLGGALATADPEFALEHLNLDYLILGEGEVAMENLCDALVTGSDVRNVKGIAFNESGKIFRTPPQEVLIADLNNHPLPDYEGFEFEHYLNNHMIKSDMYATVPGMEKRREACIITSRNCVAKCTFCYRLMTGGHRVRTIANTMQEVQYLVDRYGVNEINLIDEMFANDKQRIYDFCKGIKPLGVRWQCQLRVGVIDEDVLTAMKDAGCFFISYGFESASKKVLKSMKKGAHPKQFEDVIRWTSKTGITIQGNWIFGDPAETLETMKETMDFARKFPALNLGMFMIIPYPGTVLYNDLKEQGKFEDLYAFYLNPSSVFQGKPLNMTGLSEEEFDFMCRKVWNETIASQTFGKILKSKKIKPNSALLDFQCPVCFEIHRDVKTEFYKSKGDVEIRCCRKCLQKVSLRKSDIYFDLFSRLRYLYHRHVIRHMLTNIKVYKYTKPVINFLHGQNKAIGLAKRILRGAIKRKSK